MVDKDVIEAKKDLTDEEIEEERKKGVSFKAQAKMYFNRANVSRYLGFVGVIIATVVVSLYQVGWDPTKIGWQAFMANVMSLLCLGTYGIFFGEAEGTNFLKKFVIGLYQKIKNIFNYWVDMITEAGYVDVLPDYITWRYQKDCEHAYRMKLLSVHLLDFTTLNLTREQLEILRNHPESFDGVDYDRLSEEQYQVLVDIKDGKIFVDYIDDYNFFIMETDNDGVQKATKVKQTNKRKEKISWKQRFSRLAMIAVIALIIAGFFKETMSGEGGGAASQSSMLVSRLTVLLGSVASGINTARLLNMEDIFVLEYKISYDKVMYYSIKNGSYEPIDYKAKAKKAVEQYHKDLEEAQKNIVEPEIVEEKTDNDSIVLLPSKDV